MVDDSNRRRLPAKDVNLSRLEVIVLGLLATSARSGYDIIRWLDQRGTFAGYRSPHSQVYRQLAKMENNGWARATKDPRDKGPNATLYQITEVGQGRLQAWIDSPYEPSPRPLDPDFQVRVMFSAVRGPEKMLELVQVELAFRRAHEVYDREPDEDLIPPDVTTEARTWFEECMRMQTERGHFMASTLIAWLESVEVRLKALTATGRDIQPSQLAGLHFQS